MPLPLASFPITSTTDPEEAQAILSQELLNLRFQTVRDRHRFRLDINGLRLGRTSIAFNRFNSEAIVDAGEVGEIVLLAIGIGAPAIAHLDGASIKSTERWPVSSSSRRLRIERPAGSGVLFIRAGLDAIEGRFREIADRRPGGPLVFDRSVDGATGVGAQARRLLDFVIDESQRDDSILQNRLLRANLDDILLDVLLMLPNNYSDQLVDGRWLAAAPGIVRRAEEYLEANAAEPITVSDVVAVCSCSRRALFGAFRKYRGYTPIQFLTECRLRCAHLALQSPAPGDTVGRIATRCGFSNLGRFAALYRARYGERPSLTLRRAIDR